MSEEGFGKSGRIDMASNDVRLVQHRFLLSE